MNGDRMPRRPACRRTGAVVVVLCATILAATACSRDAKPAADTAKPGGAADAKEAPGVETSMSKDANRVTLTEVAAATAGIVVEPVRLERMGRVGVEVPGQVEFDPARVAVISPRTSGRIERLLTVPGQRVAAGDIVALLYSPAFVTAQNDLLQAKRRSELLSRTPDANGALSLHAGARRRLQLLGATDEMIRRVEASGEPVALLPVPAPFSGSILEAPVLTGAAVEAGTPVFKIADLSVVQVAADVPERAALAVRVGLSATVRVAAAPGRTFSGRVARVSDQMDPTTRTVEAFVHVPNAGHLLKPGMSATVILHQPGSPSTTPGTAAPLLTIPAAAIVTDGGASYVFVETGPRTYERREVRLGAGVAPGMGPQAVGDERVVVVAGLSHGDRVVVHGAFTLKSELAKASFAEDEH